jgi:hypothetical protein
MGLRWRTKDGDMLVALPNCVCVMGGGIGENWI